ncbi:NEDD8-conjugating enzyme UBE2F-like [Onthophagus taurus]|uniref:NEDD8-conjugating enzyme UBE2F-like n=1 Tax=Onthophagus taurus TaxID=166361 RepID=UPI000C20CEFD|nr:NEDD8-conjugating enzyme UBE2F-like [Onthophagus taurus]
MIKMITLSQRLKRQQEQSNGVNNRISIRDKLLTREAQEMAQLLPSNCSITYENVNDLSSFLLFVKPTEGFWQDGCFKFSVKVTEEYNMVPPIVKCLTRLWHPNINETGEVCLSLLRQHSVDGLGWSPIRRLNDVVWGLHALFTDLLNFDDPLNIEAADMYRTSKEEFHKKVSEYVKLYAKE